MTPIGLSDRLKAFGQIYGQVVALKTQASRYQKTYSTWLDLMNRGENLRQVAATIQNMGAVTGQLETLVAGILGSLFPASILPEGVNQANLYAISGWEDDANAFISQMRQIAALESSGLTQTEVANTIQSTGIMSTVTEAGKNVISGISNIVIIGVVIGGIFLYMNRRR